MRILYLSFGILLGDQLTKLLIKGGTIPLIGLHVAGMPLGTSIPVWGNFLRITYIENPGMAFGIDFGWKYFFSFVSIAASLLLILFLYRNRNEHVGLRIALAMILGGAMGNLIDRVFYGVVFGEGPLFYGRVVDFIDVDFFNLNLFGYHLSRWPVFNVADASVTCGVVLLLVAHRWSTAHEPAGSGAMQDSVPGVINAPADPDHSSRDSDRP